MFTLNCKGRLLVMERPVVMGIINITPDSFFSGSRKQSQDEILQQAEKMLRDGATILDIGGQSTRPGSEQLSAQEEWKRIEDPIAAIHKNFPEAILSVDTYYSMVAENSVASGVSIINDISAGSMDGKMIETVARLGVPYVLMHMKGSPQTMQQDAVYENVTREVLDFLVRKQEELKQAGIKDIIIDPGFGFAKTPSHNFELLHHLSVFSILNRPVLSGLSRKSFIYKTIGATAEEALNGTIAMNTLALEYGAFILRVHDVREAAETIKLWEACRS